MFNTKNIAVIDIGSDKIFVTIVDIAKDNTFATKSYAEMSYDGFQDGDWIDGDSVKDVVINCFNKALYNINSSISHIYVSVSGDFSKIHLASNKLNFGCNHKVNNVDIKNICDNIAPVTDGRYKIINSSVVSYVLDGKEKVLDAKEKSCFNLTVNMSYLLCKKSYCDLFNTILSSYCKKIDFISTPLAECKYLIDNDMREKNSGVLCNIGYLTTDVAYISREGLLALDTFSLGGGHIAYDLSYGLNLPFDTACYVKGQVNFNNKVQENLEIRTDKGIKKLDKAYVNMIASARLEEIAEKIKAIIDNYSIEYPKYLKVYVTGRGIDDMQGVRNILSALIGKSCEIIVSSFVDDRNKKIYTTNECLVRYVAEKHKTNNNILSNIIKLFK